MTMITQLQIDEIVKIQFYFNRLKTQAPADMQQILMERLAQLSGCEAATESTLDEWLIKEDGHIVGLDALRILRDRHGLPFDAPIPLKSVKLGGCLLQYGRGVTFDHVDFEHTHISYEHTPAIARGGEQNLLAFEGAQFLHCQLSDALFKCVNLKGARFEHCELSGTQFIYCDMSQSEFDLVHFTRMPRFVHSKLTASKAKTQYELLSARRRWSFKTATLGAGLISASVLVLGVIMLGLMPDNHFMGLLGVGLFLSGVVVGYLGASSAYTLGSHAKIYAKFEAMIQNLAADK